VEKDDSPIYHQGWVQQIEEGGREVIVLACTFNEDRQVCRYPLLVIERREW
jgi:hypothetical protein